MSGARGDAAGVRYRWRDLANPAGLLTLARLPLAAAFPFVAAQRGPALALYLLGVGTDVVDGWVARRTGTTSPAGALADGISDKTFHGVVALSLVVEGRMPWWWAGLWFSREAGYLALSPYFALRITQAPHHARAANRAGKNATVAVAVASVATILGSRTVALGATLAAGALGLLATGTYARRELRYTRLPHREPPAG